MISRIDTGRTVVVCAGFWGYHRARFLVGIMRVLAKLLYVDFRVIQRGPLSNEEIYGEQ